VAVDTSVGDRRASGVAVDPWTVTQASLLRSQGDSRKNA
jgi:hypothetical protein